MRRGRRRGFGRGRRRRRCSGTVTHATLLPAGGGEANSLRFAY
jgi:hypothetical protein